MKYCSSEANQTRHATETNSDLTRSHWDWKMASVQTQLTYTVQSSIIPASFSISESVLCNTEFSAIKINEQQVDAVSRMGRSLFSIIEWTLWLFPALQYSCFFFFQGHPINLLGSGWVSVSSMLRQPRKVCITLHYGLATTLQK